MLRKNARVQVMREKIRQKTKATGSEIDRLRRAFKVSCCLQLSMQSAHSRLLGEQHFDLEGNDRVSPSEFLLALQHFGIHVDEKARSSDPARD